MKNPARAKLVLVRLDHSCNRQ